MDHPRRDGQLCFFLLFFFLSGGKNYSSKKSIIISKSDIFGTKISEKFLIKNKEGVLTTTYQKCIR